MKLNQICKKCDKVYMVTKHHFCSKEYKIIKRQVIIKCAFCKFEKTYWVTKSADEIKNVLSCSQCGQPFNKKPVNEK